MGAGAQFGEFTIISVLLCAGDINSLTGLLYHTHSAADRQKVLAIIKYLLDGDKAVEVVEHGREYICPKTDDGDSRTLKMA